MALRALEPWPRALQVEEMLRTGSMFQMRIQEQEVELIQGIPETLQQQLHEAYRQKRWDMGLRTRRCT